MLACTHLWLQLRRPAHQMKAALKTNWNQQRQCALLQQPLASPFFAHHVQRRSLDQPSACLPSSSRLVPRHFNSPVRPASSVRRDTRHSLRTRAIWHTCSSGEAAQDRRHTRCTQGCGRHARHAGAHDARLQGHLRHRGNSICRCARHGPWLSCNHGRTSSTARLCRPADLL